MYWALFGYTFFLFVPMRSEHIFAIGCFAQLHFAREMPHDPFYTVSNICFRAYQLQKARKHQPQNKRSSVIIETELVSKRSFWMSVIPVVISFLIGTGLAFEEASVPVLIVSPINRLPRETCSSCEQYAHKSKCTLYFKHVRKWSGLKINPKDA